MMAQETILVNSVPGVVALLDQLQSIDIPRSSSLTVPPCLYCDLEGVYLGREGTLSIFTLYVAPIKKVYLIDIFNLKDSAFSTASGGGWSLKTMLEDATIGKAFFDIRNDSDALFSGYNVSVAGIHDLQLMELASRSGWKRTVAGLAKCIERDITMAFSLKTAWLQAKKAGEALWSPQKGGRYEVFNDRPLRPEIIKYCAQDVILLPELWRVYRDRLPKAGNTSGVSLWENRILYETAERVKLSQSAGYNGHGEHKALGPASFQ